jgi:glycosyltransferase involved in cell wall biosynthesis
VKRPPKVLINAQLAPGGSAGGIEQFLMGLVSGLGRLTDGEEEYILITRPESPDWLRHLMGPNQRCVAVPAPKPGRAVGIKRLLGPLRRPAGELRIAVHRFLSGGPNGNALPQSDGFYESLGGDIIHFPFQAFTRCSIPSIYNPWDLQHLHYPQFWSKKVIACREAVYRGACNCAQAVVTASSAVKSDLQQQYGLDAQKTFVIHCAPPAALYESITDEVLRDVRARYRLPELFAFFPAQTWAHKNHLRLLEALRLLRDRHGIRLNLVCTGAKNEHWPVIAKSIDNLGLQTEVMFLGFVSPIELRSLYRLAQFVVFPSLFEGAGLPVIEAFQERVAVTCSDIPPLREYGDDAVLTFDPLSVESIAASLLRISSDEALREQLRARGLERARLFTWERTGKTYRALYRKVAGVSLTEEDLHLLTSNNGR